MHDILICLNYIIVNVLWIFCLFTFGEECTWLHNHAQGRIQKTRIEGTKEIVEENKLPPAPILLKYRRFWK